MNIFDYQKILDDYCEPAIMLHRPFPPLDLPPVNSRLGGLPSLPASIDWPVTSEKTPLHFLAQIDCSELPALGILPESGMLYFFARIDEEMIWGDGAPQDDCRVIFSAENGTAPQPAPVDLPVLEGGYSNWERGFQLPGDPPFTTYPSWPLQPLAMRSWPDYDALPYGTVEDGGQYHDLLNRTRAAEMVRAAGLPLNSPYRPSWGVQTQDAKGPRITLPPSPSEQPFPQAWIMVDRIARYLANWANQQLERSKTPLKSYFDNRQLQHIHQDAVKWVQLAAEHGLDQRPEDKRGQRFSGWLDKLAGDSSPHVRSGVGTAMVAGLQSAIQFAAASPEAAELIPPIVYNEAEHLHLPASADKIGIQVKCDRWRFAASCHQMLGNAPSSQDARPVERQDILLLHLFSDDAVNFMFCDVGEVEFWIGKDDLAAGRFDRVRATTCGG